MVTNIGIKEFEENILKSNKITLVDFFATWCGPCKMLAPVLEDISNEKKELDFFKIDIDENQELAIEYNIEYVPTVIIFKNGVEIGRINGLLDKQEFIEQIEEYIK